MSSLKAVIYDALGFSDASVQKVRAAFPDVEFALPEKDDLAAALTDADVFFGFLFEAEVLENAPQLKWIQSTSAGMEKLLTEKLSASDIAMTNASGVHGPAVCETAWALTLAVAQRLPRYFQQQKDHVWAGWEKGSVSDLAGATAGVIGLGGIGRRYAAVASAFEMRVIAVDRHTPPKPDYVSELRPIDQLDGLIAESDVVMIACPYSSETHHLINADRLALMKPTGILINIARGSIVDEEALHDTLINGRIAGAGCDVFEQEPLPPDSPMWDVPNLVLTPHVAGYAENRMDRLMDFFADNLRRFIDGEELVNVIDRTVGYPIP